MNRSERLNDMMRYLNDKTSFKLKDITTKYSISKSTALRDIKSLEEIGMPIYSQLGRNGCYGMLQNKLLSPIVFNLDEVFALYFSMLTLRNYETTPFHLSVERLKQKFENCLAPEKIQMLRKTEKVFRLGSIPQNNHCEFLKDILQFAIQEKVCEVSYLKTGHRHDYKIQFFDISASFGQWYATGYNFETEHPQVLRCDKVVEIKECKKYASKPFADFTNPENSIYRTESATDFKVEVNYKGVDLFQKEHYPSMRLEEENKQYFICGFYNQGEEVFIANYFLGYGETILSINPVALSKQILERLGDLHQHFEVL